jgi:HD superfamily phosphohydrolase
MTGFSFVKTNKRKVINDPVYGFITIPDGLVFDIIEHPWFQRLRRIKQLGLTGLVYPGALHTRFQHALGAMHLMQQAIDVLRSKGHRITDHEAQAAYLAILLHDIGHGPFSHALEHSLVTSLSHEDLSLFYMKRLNQVFDGRLGASIEVFTGRCEKTFLHQLVSSQLDMDRLDYLKRDSYYTGVSEGVAGTDRIIAMLDVVRDSLVAEQKGIYSIENFLVARRLMYWQVYLHKTVIAAEYMLTNILRRARHIYARGQPIFATPALEFFLRKDVTWNDFEADPMALEYFSHLGDDDIQACTKVWSTHPDKVLASLSHRLVNRILFRIEMQNRPFDYFYIEKLKDLTRRTFNLGVDEVDYFVYTDMTSNYAYHMDADKILILRKDGSVNDIASASDQLNISVLSSAVIKHFLCYPKELSSDNVPGEAENLYSSL